MATWNPTTYLAFADERARPFFDLVSRITAQHPQRVVDLGCGPGQLTAALADRWPDADVTGIDSSPEMVERARQNERPRLSFHAGDVQGWWPEEPVDVIVSNATMQWVPGHRDVLRRLRAAVAREGWLAFQVPGNFDEPGHRLLRDLARTPPYADATRGVEEPSAHDALTYLADLAAPRWQVDAWETSYLHVLQGPDAVFRWISGTGAQPVLQALTDAQRHAFVGEYKRLLRAAYPRRDVGTVLPFRRVFVVAHHVA